MGVTAALNALQNQHVRLRTIETCDIQRLADILREKDVREWWGLYDLERVRAEFLRRGSAFAIEVGDAVVGAVELVESPGAAGHLAFVDLFVTREQRGRGIGSEAMRLVASAAFAHADNVRLVASPCFRNERAIRFFTSLGFVEFDRLRHFEPLPNGHWKDCMLLALDSLAATAAA